MSFFSILYGRAEDRPTSEPLKAPDFFTDLNLDQIIETITAGKSDYYLKPLFYMPLHDADTIRYRQEVMRDLENPRLYACFQSFGQEMRTMREYLRQIDKLHYPYQKKAWFLDTVEIYCTAVKDLVEELAKNELTAQGLIAFREYLITYAESPRFVELWTDNQQLKAELKTVRYSLHMKGLRIEVHPFSEGIDYSREVASTFEKFSQDAVKNYLAQFPVGPDMDEVEARILDRVAQLYPDIFGRLLAFSAMHGHYLDETIEIFDREVQFYLSVVDYMAFFKRAGLPVCYPRLSTTVKAVQAHQAYDAALAYKLINERTKVVCNDVDMADTERILVISGPNQGGKTTFARMFGQLHYLASLGCPVPGTAACLFLFDKIFTHFETEEHLKTLRGKLQDDLIRIHDILTEATPESLIILNEIFTSTTLQDALFLSQKVMETIVQLDALCVCVTFLDELASFSDTTVSLVGTVDPEQPAMRTYKIIRKPADGISYALSLAEKYRVTYLWLKERIL